MATGIANVKGSGGGSNLLTTTTDATLVSGTTYELALTYLTETPKINDFIAYVDSDLIKTLYKVTAVDSTNATLTKIGDIGGGGKQLYQHNISGTLGARNWNTVINFSCSIINDSNTPINTHSLLKQYLIDKGFTVSSDSDLNTNKKYFSISGYGYFEYSGGNNTLGAYGLVVTTNSPANYLFACGYRSDTKMPRFSEVNSQVGSSIVDTVIAL